MIFMVLCTMMVSATSLSFNLTTLDGGNITVGGDAYAANGEIQLTNNQAYTPEMKNTTGYAEYHGKLRLWDEASGEVTNFTTHFSFAIYSPDKNCHGDGMTFFLAHPDLRLPEQLGSFGGGLGIVHDYRSAPPFPFVAVEFDTFMTYEFSDPQHNHAGIDVNSLRSVNSTPWPSALDGTTDDAWVTYDSVSKTLRFVFTGNDDVTNEVFKRDLEYGVDMKKELPEYVKFGFSASSGACFEAHTIKSWSFSSTLVDDVAPAPAPARLNSEPTLPEPRIAHKKLVLVVAVGVGVAAAVVCGVLIWLYCFRRYKTEETEDLGFDDTVMDEEFRTGTGPKKFSFDELERATNKFAEELKLGEGGFGGVYRGYLKELKCHVAVKSVSKGSKQGVKEYASEVRIIGRLRHKNLVQLVGWCHERRGLLLVYEIMSNGSLDLHLFKEKTFLSWDRRYKIAQDLASALLYLHEEWEQCVVHRDIKSSNVMLDDSFSAKLGDFGLARLVDHGKESDTTVLAGTLGYLAPECSATGKTSKESDVYAFGVVLLEVSCGRKPHTLFVGEEERVLVQWVWELYGRGRLFEAADPRLSGEFKEDQMERLMVVGLWCAHPDHNTRPSIKKASHVLNGESPLPLLPAKMPIPTYEIEGSLDLYMFSSGSGSGSRSRPTCERECVDV